VGHQLVHGGRVDGIFGDHLAVGVDAFENLQVRELGNVVCDGILGAPFALLVEDHHGDAGDDLGHGEDAEDRVGGHRRAAGEISLAVGFEVDELSVAHDERDGAGHGFLLVDFLLNGGVKTLEAFCGETDGFRRDGTGSCGGDRLGGGLLSRSDSSDGSKRRDDEREQADGENSSQSHVIFLFESDSPCVWVCAERARGSF
jgi:hypothetical protein